MCIERVGGEYIYIERERERQKGIREAEREQVGSIVLVMTRVWGSYPTNRIVYIRIIITNYVIVLV